MTILLLTLMVIVVFRFNSILTHSAFDSNFFAALNTQYTDHFTYEKLSTIRFGTGLEEIKQILGIPFSIWNDNNGSECLLYSRPKSKENLIIPLKDISWISLGVCINEEQKFTSIARNRFYD